MRIAGSFPFLPHRLMVRGETRKIVATSRIVKRSGKSDSDTFADGLVFIDIDRIIMRLLRNVKSDGHNSHFFRDEK